MRTIGIVVCDDELPALRRIARAVGGCFEKEGFQAEIRTFSSPEALSAALLREDAKVFFLDIEMPGENGIRLAEKIRAACPEAFLVFVSGREDYVFESFRVHPFSFIRKASLEEDLSRTVRDLAALLARDEASRTVILQDEMGHPFPADTGAILYLEVRDKYVQVVTEEGETLLRSSLKEMERQLQDGGFLRCHKSFLVNIRKIYSIRHDHLLLTNGKELPLRRGSAMELKKALAAFLGGGMAIL